MGSAISRLFRKLFGRKECRVLLLGLDAAGKTTVMYQLAGKPRNTVPTIGFNVETVRFRNLEFVVWDVSGQDKVRAFWRHYYHGTRGIVFVVDSNDQERIPVARKELHAVLQEVELEGASLLVLCNKIDLPNAISPEELQERLDVALIEDRKVHVARTIGTTGEGVEEAFEWLANSMT